MTKGQDILDAYDRLVEGDSPFDVTFGHCQECQRTVPIDPDYLKAGMPEKCEDHLPLSNFQHD